MIRTSIVLNSSSGTKLGAAGGPALAQCESLCRRQHDSRRSQLKKNSRPSPPATVVSLATDVEIRIRCFWRLRYTVVAWAILLTLSEPIAAAGELPGAPQSVPIVLTGGTVHRVEKPPKKLDLLFADGQIQAIAADVQGPENVVRIDVTGQHVYPGLIDSNSSMGLIEIDAVRATNDLREVGPFNPNARAAVAFNPDSEMIPVTRANGILLTNIVPLGSFVTGQSSLVMLDGWNVSDMTVATNTGLHVRWPRIELGKTDNERLNELTTFFDEARAYGELRSQKNGKFDVRLEAMQPVLQREVKMFVHANTLLAIHSAIAFADKQGVQLAIVGGYDAPQVARLLKKRKIPVIVTGTHRLPTRRHAAYDDPFTVPRRLYDAGVKFCIGGSGRFGASNVRNLPNQAGTAVAFGLPADAALRSITLSAAEILGAENRVGSLAPGKEATLFVANGDILEVATQVTRAFVQGRDVSLESRHTRLFKKFRTKHERNQ